MIFDRDTMEEHQTIEMNVITDPGLNPRKG